MPPLATDEGIELGASDGVTVEAQLLLSTSTEVCNGEGRKEVYYTAWSTHERRKRREHPDVASYSHHVSGT
jgi:hypothetical protein